MSVIHSTPPPIPIVMSGPPALDQQWSMLKKDGVTTLRYRPAEQFLPDGGGTPDYDKPVFDFAGEQLFAAEAHKAGLGVWLLLQNLAYAHTRAQLGQVTALCNTLSPRDIIHGADEPIHWRGLTVSQLRPAYNACHKVTTTPWVTIEPGCGRKYVCPPGRNAQLAAFNPVSDELGSDQNPVAIRTVGDVHLNVIGQNTARMHRVGGKRRVWAALQLCSAGSRLPGSTQIVEPSPAQLRYEMASALANGARAFSIYGVDLRKCMTDPADIAAGFNWHGYRARMRPALQLLAKVRPHLGACVRLKAPAGMQVERCGHLRIALNLRRFTFQTKVVR